ncbi:MAG: RNA polymerase factor sigma-32, partial [Planctomycetota bacterium]
HGQSLAEIAEQMGLSKERVRQIALTSLEKLREQMTFEEFEALT